MFFEFVRAVGAILTAAAALLGLYLGVTRSARLRRREQLYREALTALAESDPQRRIVYELHRAALADIVARQLTGNWRTIWPWFAWLVLAAFFGQAGYSVASYTGSDAPWNFGDAVVASTGDLMTAIILVGMLLAFIPQIYRAYRLTLIGRVTVARRFHEGESVRRPTTLMELEIEHDLAVLRQAQAAKQVDKVDSKPARPTTGLKEPSWQDLFGNLREYRRALIPGLFAAGLGFCAGVQLWISLQPGDQATAAASVAGLVPWSVLLLVLTLVPAATLWRNLRSELKAIGPPQTYPTSSARLRTQLGSRGSRHGVQPAPRRVAGPVKRQAAPAARRSRRAAPRRQGRRRLRWPARLRLRRPRRRSGGRGGGRA